MLADFTVGLCHSLLVAVKGNSSLHGRNRAGNVWQFAFLFYNSCGFMSLAAKPNILTEEVHGHLKLLGHKSPRLSFFLTYLFSSKFCLGVVWTSSGCWCWGEKRALGWGKHICWWRLYWQRCMNFWALPTAVPHILAIIALSQNILTAFVWYNVVLHQRHHIWNWLTTES